MWLWIAVTFAVVAYTVAFIITAWACYVATRSRRRLSEAEAERVAFEDEPFQEHPRGDAFPRRSVPHARRATRPRWEVRPSAYVAHKGRTHGVSRRAT
jgi:hypothetical protein